MNACDFASLTHRELCDLARKLGNTRMEAIRVLLHGRPRTIHLKLEADNPTGSVKDRTAWGLLQTLERRGRLQPGSCLVESTSGNLGVALAFLCRLRGYSFIAVVDPKTTPENVSRMQALGAEVDMVRQPDEHGGYLLSRLARIREYCERSAHYVWPNQYANAANPLVHRQMTGPEIYRQMQGKVDAIFLAVSTGGTLAGIAEYFREVSPRTRIIAVDAYGSVVFGTPAAPRKLTGIGASQPSRFLRREHYDEYLLVTDREAFSVCRSLAASVQIQVGGSSGAVLAACLRYLEQHSELERVVCLCPDGGANYTSSIYQDAWLQENGIELDKIDCFERALSLKGTKDARRFCVSLA
ncbi:cysteine synthase A [Thermosporothrix hazakensis]|jgi:cysteine synthase A|uniref:N-(2-amino-2-carboxyethyl)-L-glutamate synthase n=2 Tax=Thermosporothrix TaxID=768650 RepID=A0A326U0I1_THEHA|nr:2,3-diaminopropionate biosynthesis protein SbnA [Thermosporothrix hazakensis]PZW22853.1 cysteine synthase A [Thermosporothrix hazakensis]BBH91678.1 hypothetical protein KTC_64290 [Thermosporothrix sp. COM3]GCE49820.1 hypothetical protein KTH_46890 [Thermosporothrix hazakensis]